MHCRSKSAKCQDLTSGERTSWKLVLAMHGTTHWHTGLDIRAVQTRPVNVQTSRVSVDQSQTWLCVWVGSGCYLWLMKLISFLQDLQRLYWGYNLHTEQTTSIYVKVKTLLKGPFVFNEKRSRKINQKVKQEQMINGNMEYIFYWRKKKIKRKSKRKRKYARQILNTKLTNNKKDGISSW